jgi:beta-glucosidase
MPALVEAWQPGTEGGNGLARLLFGEVNFSGKLTMTFPRSEGQIPIYYNNYRTGRPPFQSYSSWYQDMSTTPLFEFGYGLSYTDFSVGEPTIDKEQMARGKTVQVCAEVENTGKRAGEIVVQLYICDEHASLTRPMKELKGYQKISLEAGEKRTVCFEINEKMLEFWSENNKFEAEDGWFKAWIALSSKVQTPVRFKLG